MSNAMLRKILYLIGMVITVFVVDMLTGNDTVIIISSIIMSTLTLIDVVEEN